MSVFLFRVKSSSFDRAQAKDGQSFVLHVRPDPLLDTCGAGDSAIICTEVNKSAPACFGLSAVNKDTPLRYSAKIIKYDPTRKDSHLIKYPNGLEQNKNLGRSTLKVTKTASGEVVEETTLKSAASEGLEVTIENPAYSFQVQTSRCNLLLDGELVIESDSEDTQAYRKIEDDSYISAIQSLIASKAENGTTEAQVDNTASSSSSSSSFSSSSPTPSAPSSSSAPVITSPPSPSPSSTSTPNSPTIPAPSSTSPPATPTPPTTTTTAPTPKPEPSQPTASPKATPPPPPSHTGSKPPPPQPQPHKPKPRGRPPGSGHHSHAHNNANGHGEKRESEAKASDANKKAKLAPPASDITSVDLLMHVTSVAGMLKELDNEHSERLQRLEDEVAQLKARLGGTTPSSPVTSTSLTKDSPTMRKAAPVSQSPPVQKSQKPVDPLQFTPGEFIAVRVDPATSQDGYWMARVIPGPPKGGLVKVKWFEKYAPLPGWYFMDTREDLVDPMSIFHRNFELVVKPWKNRAGNFVDIFRPLEDLTSFDAER